MDARPSVYRFGPFVLDPGFRRLARDGESVPLRGRQMDVLLALLAHAGQLVPKAVLVRDAWNDTAVSDSAVFQAVSRVRQALGTQPDGEPYIETLSREGYRFAAPIEVVPSGHVPVVHETLEPYLAPHRALVNGRTAIEQLERDTVDRARRAFGEGLLAAPDDAAGHVGLATALVLQFDSTRSDVRPDTEALTRADQHARTACRLDPRSGDAWGTLGLVLARLGHDADAQAAARKAATLEPASWQHQVRLALVSWGESRLRAARRARTLHPGLALAHWLAAGVFVARGAFDMARSELDQGCALIDAQASGHGPFRAVGLHLLRGLVAAAEGCDDEGLACIAREIARADERHVYGRECLANAWYSSGALLLRSGRVDDAMEAFHRALHYVPGHALALVGLSGGASVTAGAAARGAADRRAMAEPPPAAAGVTRRTPPIDAAMVEAAALVLAGRHDDAVRVFGAALTNAAAGMPGWLLPVEPLLNVTARPGLWAPVLAIVRVRAC